MANYLVAPFVFVLEALCFLCLGFDAVDFSFDMVPEGLAFDFVSPEAVDSVFVFLGCVGVVVCAEAATPIAKNNRPLSNTFFIRNFIFVVCNMRYKKNIINITFIAVNKSLTGFVNLLKLIFPFHLSFI